MSHKNSTKVIKSCYWHQNSKYCSFCHRFTSPKCQNQCWPLVHFVSRIFKMFLIYNLHSKDMICQMVIQIVNDYYPNIVSLFHYKKSFRNRYWRSWSQGTNIWRDDQKCQGSNGSQWWILDDQSHGKMWFFLATKHLPQLEKFHQDQNNGKSHRIWLECWKGLAYSISANSIFAHYSDL